MTPHRRVNCISYRKDLGMYDDCWVTLVVYREPVRIVQIWIDTQSVINTCCMCSAWDLTREVQSRRCVRISYTIEFAEQKCRDELLDALAEARVRLRWPIPCP